VRYERTDLERLTDNAVLLSLWAKAQEQAPDGAAGDRLKLMKLAFLAAYPLYVDRVKALNLRFFRWKKGPMADQVYDTWDDLVARRFLLDEEEFIVSDEGVRLAHGFTTEVLGVPQNVQVLDTLQRVAGEYGALDTPEVLERVYHLRCYTLDSPGRQRQVKALPLGHEITGLLEEDEADSVLYVPPGWQMTLELAFHPDALRNLQRGIEDTHQGRVCGWDAMWTDV
jgi:hypothetical protein